MLIAEPARRNSRRCLLHKRIFSTQMQTQMQGLWSANKILYAETNQQKDIHLRELSKTIEV